MRAILIALLVSSSSVWASAWDDGIDAELPGDGLSPTPDPINPQDGTTDAIYRQWQKGAAVPVNRTSQGSPRGNRSRPDGILGARQEGVCSDPTYILACPSTDNLPCCAPEFPICCRDPSDTCCGEGTFCVGLKTCCFNGQTGCGEGCCAAGTTCCGNSVCCNEGFVCQNNSTCEDPLLSSRSVASLQSLASVSSVSRLSASRTASNGGNNSQTPGSPNPSNSSDGNNNDNNNNNNGNNGNNDNQSANSNSAVIGGAVGGAIGGLLLIGGIIAAVIIWRKKQQPKGTSPASMNAGFAAPPPPANGAGYPISNPQMTQSTLPFTPSASTGAGAGFAAQQQYGQAPYGSPYANGGYGYAPVPPSTVATPPPGSWGAPSSPPPGSSTGPSFYSPTPAPPTDAYGGMVPEPMQPGPSYGGYDASTANYGPSAPAGAPPSQPLNMWVERSGR